MRDKLLIAGLAGIVGCLCTIFLIFSEGRSESNVYIAGVSFLIPAWFATLYVMEIQPENWFSCRINSVMSGVLTGASLTMLVSALREAFATGRNDRTVETIFFLGCTALGAAWIALMPIPSSTDTKTPSRI